MKLRVYLDTSVISALHDARYPERAELTSQFWERRADFEVSTSELARQEVGATRDLRRREEMLAVLADYTSTR